MCVLENPAITDGSKLLIRDSYSDSLVPFLAQCFSEVHLVDLRYYHASVADYMAEQGIDTAVVLYSVSNFITDRNLIYLAPRGWCTSVFVVSDHGNEIADCFLEKRLANSVSFDIINTF